MANVYVEARPKGRPEGGKRHRRTDVVTFPTQFGGPFGGGGLPACTHQFHSPRPLNKPCEMVLLAARPAP
jgi:hypothetical protein